MKSRSMVKQAGKLSKKLQAEERAYQKLMRSLARGAKYHKAERQLVLWTYPKMILVWLLSPWKWKLAYYPASKNKATGWQMTLTEKGAGARKKDGSAYREVLHRSESRVLSLEKGYLINDHLMGKGLAENYAVRIVVRKKKKEAK